MSTGPRAIFGLQRVATRARIDNRSNPDVEYTGRPAPAGSANGKEMVGGGPEELLSARDCCCCCTDLEVMLGANIGEAGKTGAARLVSLAAYCACDCDGSDV